MATADHSHPELERILGRLVDFSEALLATQRDMALTLERIEARLGSIEDALRGPGRN